MCCVCTLALRNHNQATVSYLLLQRLAKCQVVQVMKTWLTIINTVDDEEQHKGNIVQAVCSSRTIEPTDTKLITFYRMSKHAYLELVKLVVPAIQKIDTNMRECVTAEERILITLRYGTWVQNVSLYYLLSSYFATEETTKLIWDVLKVVYMPVRTINEWKTIIIWDLSNCIGAVDGKHIRIEKFPNTGPQNYNYKFFHSTVLLACCDADWLFTMTEPGYTGRNSDGGIFNTSAMKFWMTHGGLDTPTPSPLEYDETKSPLPYYFVGDEAFPLSHYMMRPYSQRTLDSGKRIFNFRLSRGRKTIECTFGMAAEKFTVLNGCIRSQNAETINFIVKSACVLHNVVQKLQGIDYRRWRG
ncbi:hypothetical protein PR048_004204 [Dryococelus australis]|uniref:DDE Tnp4 domain-containing protein n=1 Tax=Dryococelus australis TaxID=614101 RepID=A0ABQ9I4W4_9NEOP|nr:hypothetical protein PR048_004204 [Dryococelus australis]